MDRRFLLTLAATTVLPGTLFAQSANFPSRAVRLVVPYGAGGVQDALARLIAPSLEKRLGQPVVVENRPGAAAVVGVGYVSKQPADGYSMVILPASAMVPAVNKDAINFDFRQEFVPLVGLYTSGMLMVARDGLPASNVQELIAYAKSNPGKLNVGAAGSLGQLAWRKLLKTYGLSATEVLYKSAAESARAIAAGEVDTVIDNPALYQQLVAAGRVRAVGYTASPRLPQFTDVPTMQEAGMPGAEFSYTTGLWIRTDTPRPIVQRLSEELARVMGEPEVRQRMQSLSGVVPRAIAADDMRRITDAEWKTFTEAAQ